MRVLLAVIAWALLATGDSFAIQPPPCSTDVQFAGYFVIPTSDHASLTFLTFEFASPDEPGEAARSLLDGAIIPFPDLLMYWRSQITPSHSLYAPLNRAARRALAYLLHTQRWQSTERVKSVGPSLFQLVRYPEVSAEAADAISKLFRDPEHEAVQSAWWVEIQRARTELKPKGDPFADALKILSETY